MQEDRRLAARLSRAIARSRAIEAPECEVVEQTLFPPLAEGSGVERDAAYCNGVEGGTAAECGVPYAPVRPDAGARDTLSLAGAIVQRPISGPARSFEIASYLPHDPEGAHGGAEPAPDRSNDLATALKYRAFKNALRAEPPSFYRGLPRDPHGAAVFDPGDIDKFSDDEIRSELRARGFRCSGARPDIEATWGALTFRLRRAVAPSGAAESAWRRERIVGQELRSTNMRLPAHARNALADLEQRVNDPIMQAKILETPPTGDPTAGAARLAVLADLSELNEDPVTFLNLDAPLSGEADPEEIEKIKSAPVVYDTAFIAEMARPSQFRKHAVTTLPDRLPRTVDLQPDYSPRGPIGVSDANAQPQRDEREIAEMKKEYLSIAGGAHEMTLPVGERYPQELADRFEVPLDFLGDACCRLGASTPISLDTPLRGIISYSAIWDLLQFLNVCDGGELGLLYAPFDVVGAARILGASVDEVKAGKRIASAGLEAIGVKLPFGEATKLNFYCLKALELHLKDPDANAQC